MTVSRFYEFENGLKIVLIWGNGGLFGRRTRVNIGRNNFELGGGGEDILKCKGTRDSRHCPFLF